LSPSPLASRLGIALPLSQGISPADLLRIGVEADRRGLRAVDAGEHASTDSLALLGALAVATERIELGTAIVSPLVRSPALIAMGAATMASLAPGRFVLGLGIGSPIVGAWHGREYGRALAVMEATLDAVRAAVAGQSLPEWGRFRLVGIGPVQIPIHLAALNPRMIELAALRADGLILNFAGPEQVRTIAARVRSLRVEAGLATPVQIIASAWAYVGPEPELAADRVRSETSVYLAVPSYQHMAAAHAGMERVRIVEQAWREGGRAAATRLVPQSVVDGVYAGGTPEAVAERSGELLEAGADAVRLVTVTTHPGDPSVALDLIAALANA
jgi:alkanesulfonate monooxygenase SsuD/methylene tetrahydromethanopterin reductase-like flavin-dependent oxidoreductase (luciferase family)